MDFSNFKPNGVAKSEAFEAMCNHLFESWLRREYKNELSYFTTVNGSGGDGGVEAYAVLKNGEIIGVQAKWFPETFSDSQIAQIKKSIIAAIKIRPNIKKYIVCFPREFTSLKTVKGGKTAKKTDETMFNGLISDVNKTYSNLKIEKWDSHRISKELSFEENEGIQKYYFEKEVLSLKRLKNKFEDDCLGWLKERYIPDLHTESGIESKIEEMLSTSQYRIKEIKHIDECLQKIETVEKLICEFDSQITKTDLNENLKKISLNLAGYKTALNELKDCINLGQYEILLPHIKEVDIWETKYNLEEKFIDNRYRNLQLHLSSALEQVHQLDLPSYFPEGKDERYFPHNLIVLGKASVGKTHALANAVKKRLNEDLPTFIIQAKSSLSFSWSAILQNALGLNSWNSDEIFTALETLAVRSDVKRAKIKNSNLVVENEPTRVLIAIDGIDEVANPIELSNWRNRINQLKAFLDRYPRIRFLISARGGYEMITYQNPLKLDYTDWNEKGNRRYDLAGNDRVSLSTLIPLYLDTYGIRYDKPETLDLLFKSFENPLALRLFCEEFKGDDISTSNLPIVTSLRYLINKKVERIENEYHDIFRPLWLKEEQIIRKTLVVITDFLKDSKNLDYTKQYLQLDHEAICAKLLQNLNGVINRNDAAKILSFLCQHGILLNTSIYPEDDLLPSKTMYSVTFESYLDHFVAARTVREIIEKGTKNIPDFLEGYPNIYNVLELVALTLLNNHNIIIGENGYWIDDLEDNVLKELKYTMLGKSDENVLKAFLGTLEVDFIASPLNRYLITEHILIPNFQNENLKLGIIFLHKILSSFKNTFERDLFWSGEAFSSENKDYDIARPIMHAKAERNIENTLSPLNFDSDSRFLNNNHCYWDLPMYYAWCLTSTNNYLRELCRKSLSKWAANKIEDFVKLLDLMFFCGDPQVQEDLSRIMLGAVTLIKNKGRGLELLSKWVVTNIFDENKVQYLKNSVVRYCARIVVERAFIFDESTQNDLKLARPPYLKNDNLLELDFSGDDDAHEGRYPVAHDLDWYVIDKSFKGFLDYRFSGGQYDKFTEGVLKPYREKYEMEIDPKTFAVSAAITFIKNLGFNRSEREGHTITEKSHGSISQNMTFEEKYTWLSVHEIQGYLADLVEYQNFDKSRSFINDYSFLVHVPNPIDETELTGYSSHDYIDFAISYDRLQNETWFIPTEIAAKVQFQDTITKENLEKWTKEDIDYDFKKWIITKDFFTKTETQQYQEAVILYNDTHITDPLNIGSVSWCSVCILVKNNQFDLFIAQFQDKREHFMDYPFEDLDTFNTRTKASYFSPRDLTWMSWIEEENSKIEWKNFEIHNTTSKVIDDTVTRGEQYYILPSKMIRENSKITSYENGKSFNNESNFVTWTHKTTNFHSEWGNRQEILFIDKQIFDKILDKNNLKPVWIFHQLKNTTLEFRKIKTNPFFQNSKKWIVWESNDKMESYKYHDAYYNNQNDPSV